MQGPPGGEIEAGIEQGRETPGEEEASDTGESEPGSTASRIDSLEDRVGRLEGDPPWWLTMPVSAFLAAAYFQNGIYVLAGQSTMDPRSAQKFFWKLDLTHPAGTQEWEELVIVNLLLQKR